MAILSLLVEFLEAIYRVFIFCIIMQLALVNNTPVLVCALARVAKQIRGWNEPPVVRSYRFCKPFFAIHHIESAYIWAGFMVLASNSN